MLGDEKSVRYDYSFRESHAQEPADGPLVGPPASGLHSGPLIDGYNADFHPKAVSSNAIMETNWQPQNQNTGYNNINFSNYEQSVMGKSHNGTKDGSFMGNRSQLAGDESISVSYKLPPELWE